jgi:dTDP-4-dehydrorhamnose reductase
MSNPKFFIVGARGYIGKALFLSAKNLGVTFGTSSSGDNGLLSLSFDSSADFEYEKISPGDVVLVTAAISAPDVCANEYKMAWDVNVIGTSRFIQNVINRGARVIFFSSDTVYGERDKEFDEATPCNPVGEYAEMKYAVEERFAGNSLFKTIRLSYVFSREDRFTRYLVACAERDQEADIFHPFFRAIVYLNDVVEGALALATRWDEIPEQVINLGGPQVLSRIDFAKCLRNSRLFNLRYKITTPDADFFKNRPRVISMASPVFVRLLGRQPRSLLEATNLEPTFFKI